MVHTFRHWWRALREPVRFSRWLSSLSAAEFTEFADAVLNRLTTLNAPPAREGPNGIAARATSMKPSGEPEIPCLLRYRIPRSRDQILAIATHLARRVAGRLGKSPPPFSENAAAFLASRSWEITDLADRIAHAVASSQGSLIVAADLMEQIRNRGARPQLCWRAEELETADAMIRHVWRDFARRRRFEVST
jgi:hypothetical protein